MLLPLQLFIPEYDVVLKRMGHSVAAITINPQLIEVTIFGGCRQFDYGTTDKEQFKLLSGTTVLKFGRPCINY